ncbi:MAG: response regulator, partial [Oligoflexales bacterium]|nr:response regulator [Oligoflexales bacterium]
LYRLVNQLLDFQKLSSKKTRIKLQPINIFEFIRICSEYFISICFSRNISLCLDMKNNDNIFILGQLDALEKIAFNYFSNALKHTPEGGTIDLVLGSTDSHVSFCVRDSGPGISRENLTKLFKIFSQTEDSAAGEYEGSGLGLALVKELTEAMNGEVFVESTLGQGAMFGVRFKKYYPDECEADSENMDGKKMESVNLAEFKPKIWNIEGMENLPFSEDQQEEKEDLTGEGRLILIIDDLKDMRDLIARLLKRKSYRIITAKDGQEGLKKIESHRPDLVIVDWMMPKFTGPELIEKMVSRSDLKSIPTILLTAKSDEESKIEGIRKGAHAYLGKPFEEIELLSIVENLINLKEGEEKIRELNRNLTENVLKRFLPHKLVADIVSGKKVLDDKPKLIDVTIMFADIVGFTDIVQEIGPVRISPLLNDYLEKMTDIIFEFGGTVDKFMGDGIMVMFGAPEEKKPEVQVKDAVDCAIAMQEALKDFNVKWSKNRRFEFAMRIGIHRGSGIVGSFGGKKRSEYTVIGPVVNIASRIEGVTSPGEIFFSSQVRDNLHLNEWEKAGTFNLKGIGETILYKISLCSKKNAA